MSTIFLHPKRGSFYHRSHVPRRLHSLLNVRKLGLGTVIKHLSNLSVLFKWFEAQGFIPENSNPVRGLAPNKKQAKRAAKERRPFTDEELVKVFGSSEYRKQRDKDSARSGCR